MSLYYNILLQSFREASYTYTPRVHKIYTQKRFKKILHVVNVIGHCTIYKKYHFYGENRYTKLLKYLCTACKCTVNQLSFQLLYTIYVYMRERITNVNSLYIAVCYMYI